MKNESITITINAKIICETSQINSKPEYPWRQDNAMYLMDQKACCIISFSNRVKPLMGNVTNNKSSK